MNLTISGSAIEVDSIGNAGVYKLGTYLIVCVYGQSYYAKIYEQSTLHYIGDFFNWGQGPDDFLSFEIIKIDFPFLWVQDSKKKQIKVIDLVKTVEETHIVVEKVLSYKNIIDPFNVFFVNDSCLLIKNFDVEKGLHYLKYNPQTDSVIDNGFSMYNYPVPYEISSKMLVLADCIHPNGKKVACVTGVLNQIDILDLEHPEKSLSVTTEKKLIDYNYVKNTEEEEMEEFYFSYPVCSERFIFALFRNNTNETIEIHVIDWNGNPITKLTFDEKINIFTIDFNQGVLYGVTAVEEKTFRYDIKSIINRDGF